MDGKMTLTAETVIFAVLSLSIVIGAIFTVTRRNPITAVMSLVFTFFALSALYATLDAHFLAVLQILVYAGAIMVLFIFVVMILNREEVSPVSLRGWVVRPLGIVAGGYVAYVGASAVWRERAMDLLAGPTQALPADYGTVAGVGLAMFRDFVLPFEAISLLLLVAIVGGVILSRSAFKNEQAESRVRRLDDIRAQAHGALRQLPGGAVVAVEEGGDKTERVSAPHH
jgi:NADH-quinone oxidoreductase subunit J